MIIYDQARLGGWDIIFHATGSALFSKKSIIPALLSALAAGIISNVPQVLDYFAPKVLNGSVVFSSIQFLVSLIVVNRVREAGIRFNASQEAYIRYYASLVNLAMLVTVAIDNPKVPYTPEVSLLRTRFLRWIRAMHVLAVEEFQGYESPEFRCGTLLFTEEVLLFRERRKPTRVMHWILDGLVREKPRIGWDPQTDTNIMRLAAEVFSSYANTRRMSSQIYPFPLAQSSLLCCIAYGLFSPFAFGTMLPASTFLAPCVAFISVWLTFGFNLAAEMLEWAFDVHHNNLPMNHYSIRLINDISMLEFETVAPMVSCPYEKFMPQDVGNVDYDIPRKRPWDKKETTRAWLARAQMDILAFSGRRKSLRHSLRPVYQRDDAKSEIDYIGQGIVEMRAQGVFKLLH